MPPDSSPSSEPRGDTGTGERLTLDEIYLELPYIPDFLLEDVRYWFVPSLAAARAAYHELVGESAERWSSYYTKKGWDFIDSLSSGSGARPGSESEPREGPYRVRDAGIHLDVLPPGRIFAPKPQLRLRRDGEAIPVVSLEKHRPINPWKPSYVRGLNFIRRYAWPNTLPRRVVAAMWEIEECEQGAFSTSWMNGERVLLDCGSKELCDTLADFFYQRPEDFELGSQVYLRVLGKLGREGFLALTEQAKHPITRKRRLVARTLGELADPRGIDTLLLLLDDEDFSARDEALRALTRIGVDAESDPGGKVASFLESPEIKHRVWAAAALVRGALARSGADEQRKFLIQLVKEDPRPLSDMGELGQIIVELELLDAVPFLIKRFKSGPRDIAMDAAETLARLTGLDLEYSTVGDSEQKRAAVKALERWWEERKRERSASKRDEPRRDER
jgi:hypothetical protein